MSMNGYYRFPTIHGETVIFVSEDDLWSVSLHGGLAHRLTSNLGEVSRPRFSPDGEWVAFTGQEEGHTEVYVMPALGGVEKRLTYLGAQSNVVGWSPDGGAILFTTNANQPFARRFHLFRVEREGGLAKPEPIGPAGHIGCGHSGGAVIGRNTNQDAARWKRYRGGMAGDLWIDVEGDGQFQRLIQLDGNLSCPMWICDTIFFLSDHEGVGNLYSCSLQGENLKRHTDHEEYYARNASTDGTRIVYHAGADLYLYDPATDETRNITIDFRSPRIQRNRKFVDAAKYLEDYALHPEGHSVALTSRGKPFTMGNWEGAVLQHGQPDGARYRLTRWLNDGKRFITVSDAGGEETLEIHHTDASSPPMRLENLDLGSPFELAVSPKADAVALRNHRAELIHVDLATQQMKVLDKSDQARLLGIDWSPDGRWLAYGIGLTQQTTSLKLCRVETGETWEITRPVLHDLSPKFDPEGKYLYFLSYREFNPVYDNLHFDLSFPGGMVPCLITLRNDLTSPFVPEPKPLVEPEKKDSDKDKDKDEKKEAAEDETLRIDLEGIAQRVLAFPVSEGRYRQIAGIKGKALFSSFPAEGSLGQPSDSDSSGGKGTLEMYDFATQKKETVVGGISNFKIGPDAKTLIYRSGERLRVMKAGEKSDESKAKEKPGRESGWLDLSRVRVSVEPDGEWRQMYREAWRLQRDHFWVPDMSSVDWETVYHRYLKLLPRVATRTEFSDLMWEMQGELGTSHAYEWGGDYRTPPRYAQGNLGADFEYDAERDGYRITHIVRGDTWAQAKDSPLNGPGLNIAVGDVLQAVGGRRLGKGLTPNELLVNQAGREVSLTFAPKEGENATRPVTVKALGNETPARYREWVQQNRERVHQQTGGRVGYVHIPDMGAHGYAEFHRYYLAEISHEGLVVDVRYNGGGHVSQLILEKLARKRIGYDRSRWGQPIPYPGDSVLGPMVALNNELAGSDGDIFSHCFKLMKLGVLIGKRTWGGVIGISPRHPLVDGSLTTQPEYSFWFVDVGWGVENYGTDPDIEVEIKPQDWAQGRDPQLDRAIAEIMQQLEANPPRLPDLDANRPRLTLPKLPPRAGV